MRHALVLVFAFAACSSNGGNGGGNHDLAMPWGGDGGASGPFSVGIGPIPLAAGQEVTKCIVVNMPNVVDVDVVKLEATLAPGSHHLILYRSNETTPQPTPVDCTPFEGITNGDVPIFIAESADSVLDLPTGVSWHFAANQMVKIEAHYINTQQMMVNGMGSIVLTPASGDASSFQHADIMFCGSVSQLTSSGVPANQTDFQLNPSFFGGDAQTDLTQLKVFGFTAHEHHLGKEVTIAKSTGVGDPGTQIYDSTSWDHPPLTNLDDAHLLTFAAGEGLRWQCSYDSQDAVPPPTGTTYFGQHALTNEMCFIWAYYFPSANRFISTECWR